MGILNFSFLKTKNEHEEEKHSYIVLLDSKEMGCHAETIKK